MDRQTGLEAAARPPSLAEVAYDSIRQAIVDKTFPPGHRLTEAELARQLGISKTPVREAMVRLRHVGLLEPEGARGERVIAPSEERLRGAFEVREVIEGFTAGAAAERASAAQQAEIERAARSSVERAEAGDGEGFRRFDRAFHDGIAAAAGNPYFERMLDEILLLVRVIVERDTDIRTSRGIAEQHVEIAEAISERDAELARDRLLEHLGAARTYFLEGMALAKSAG